MISVDGFLSRVEADTNGLGCWFWNGAANVQNGYGAITTDGKKQLAHRVSFLLFNGPIPIDKPNVLHTCDQSFCVRPDHLWAGTHQDNMDDMARKGRHRSGFGGIRGARKISEEQIGIVRQLLAGGCSQTKIADMFGVCQQTIGKIKRGITWKHTVFDNQSLH